MTVSVRFTGRSDAGVQQVEARGTVQDLLAGMGLSPQEYLVAAGDRIVPVDHPLRPGEDVTLIRVVTGG